MGDSPSRRAERKLIWPRLLASFAANKSMPLINCPECGKQVSTAAHACPSCGFPVAEKLEKGEAIASPTADSAAAELLAEVRPSWWNYFWHWVFFFLIV